MPTIPQSCETTMYADDTECKSASKPEDYKELESTINNDLYRLKNSLIQMNWVSMFQSVSLC